MSAFSRGFLGFLHPQSLRLPTSIRIAIFSTRSQFAHSRVGARISSPFALRQYVKPTKSLLAVPQGYPRAYPRTFTSTEPVIRAVQATRQPVLLYKAPDKRLYMIGVYVLASSLVAGGLFTLRFRYELPKDLPFFVGPTYVVVAIIMLGIAGYIFSAPVARCSSIELIPSTLGGATVQLRIKARTIPFSSEKTIVAMIGDATINEKTWPVRQELMEADRARKQSIANDLRGMFIVRRMWEISARWLDQKWTSFFLRFKFAVLRFGIVHLKVHGNSWKIDCSGYMREEGQGMSPMNDFG
jgi:hypothetical protein